MNAYCRAFLMFALVAAMLSPLLAYAKYRVPAKEKIPVAFVITDNAVTIDFAGPWEVFKDVFVSNLGNSVRDSVDESREALSY